MLSWSCVALEHVGLAAAPSKNFRCHSSPSSMCLVPSCEAQRRRVFFFAVLKGEQLFQDVELLESHAADGFILNFSSSGHGVASAEQLPPAELQPTGVVANACLASA